MRRALLLLSLLLGACGGVDAQALALKKARLARAEHQDAQSRAPHLFGRFEEAQQKAIEHASEVAARRDYESEARLWLEAAITEAERLRLTEARLELEREIAGLEAQALEDDRARGELAERATQAAAREVVRRQSELALSRAALASKQRIKLGRAEVEEAARALIGRAALVQLALVSWGAPAAQRAPLEAKLARARAALASAPDEALAFADDTLFASLGLLASLRAGEQAGSESERAALMEGLTQSGARVTRNDRGLAVLLSKPFAGARLQPGPARLLSRLCALSRGYPRGPIQLAVTASPAGLAEARAQALRAQLPRLGCAGARFGVEVAALARAAAASAPDDQIELTWLAY